MLSSSMVKEEVELIIDSLVQSKFDDAKQRFSHLAPQVSSEYGRGALLALNGVMNVTENKTPEKMSDREKILRTAERLPKIQMMDDLDKGYLQTIAKWAKKLKETGN